MLLRRVVFLFTQLVDTGYHGIPQDCHRESQINMAKCRINSIIDLHKLGNHPLAMIVLSGLLGIV